MIAPIAIASAAKTAVNMTFSTTLPSSPRVDAADHNVRVNDHMACKQVSTFHLLCHPSTSQLVSAELELGPTTDRPRRRKAGCRASVSISSSSHFYNPDMIRTYAG